MSVELHPCLRQRPENGQKHWRHPWRSASLRLLSFSTTLRLSDKASKTAKDGTANPKKQLMHIHEFQAPPCMHSSTRNSYQLPVFKCKLFDAFSWTFLGYPLAALPPPPACYSLGSGHVSPNTQSDSSKQLGVSETRGP